MTDTTADPAPSAQPAEKSRSKAKTFVTITILLLLFLGGILGGAVAYFGPARLMAALTGPEAPAAQQVLPGAPSEPTMLDTGERATLLMEDHIVNLVSGDGPSTRFVRVRTALVYNPVKLPSEALQAQKPQLRDSFHGFLGQLTERDIEGSYGLAMIREELLRRARAVVGSDAVREILITDLVIQ